MTDEFQEVSIGSFHKWENVGEVLRGVILDIAPEGGRDFNDNVCPEVLIRTDYGDVNLTCGQAQLKRAFAHPHPPLAPGHEVIITWTGEKDTGKGNPAKQFRIQASPTVVMQDLTPQYSADEEPF